MDAKPEKNPETSWRLTSGRLLAGFSLVFCVPVGVLFVSVATGAVGIVLGIAGYALGASTLGRLAVVLCIMAMFVGLLVGQGVIPGDAYDRLVDGWFRDKPTAHFAND
jgi:hypothetical protein